jgi:hypothetical protein
MSILNHTKSVVSILLSILYVLVLCNSCNTQKPTNSSRYYTVWFSNPKEYRTNDITTAQKETPFTIILPIYLPKEFSTLPDFAGLAKKDFNNESPITITYQSYKRVPIVIEEYNEIHNVIPSAVVSTYLIYSDVQVLEQETQLMSIKDDQSTLVPGFIYTWNKNNVHFEVTIAEYGKEEAQKVIGSMIK